MTEKENGAFESGFGGFFVLAIEDPAQTAVAEVSDDGVNNAGDGAANCAARVTPDDFTYGSDAVADLAKNTLDDAGHSIVGCDSGEAFFDDFLAGGNGIRGELASGDAFGHHGDLAGFHSVADEMQDDVGGDSAENCADGEADKATARSGLGDSKARAGEAKEGDGG